MNRYARWGIALVILPMAACANQSTPAPMTPPGPPPLAAADATFIQDAAQGGLAEVQAGQLAQSKARSSRVKAYGAKMVADHTPANDQLKQIATAKGAMVPTAPNDMQMQQMTALQADMGRKFDHDYIEDQIAGHTAMLQLFQTEAASGTDPDLKKFAADTVPVVQAHLDAANALEHGGMHKGMHKGMHHHTAS
ncbi:DUF4142 domain-containing protein [Lichenicola cladoniae]|uniref:DUF4142 domain-containing protein n=1 Tax=Lichenicola cladoniae TaxID=1484109 RepID=A0A6M8HR66_9PROT|nr:DUF4142 domain-containing protein [Lichenicola cladoniae]NPD69164.1 DUF4142 domain-containing protein [Acetobacteraceae bacterium]QKE90983.1 DUF4142 domain-containing protein [Lichenicola cladoniae]